MSPGAGALPGPLPDGRRLLLVGPDAGVGCGPLALRRPVEQLLRDGVLWSGPSRDQVTGRFPPRLGEDGWAELRRPVDAPGTHRVAVVAHEALGHLDEDGARRALDELGTPGGAAPHVLLVARRLDLLLPWLWQQRVRRPAPSPDYDAWLRLVLGPERPDDREWRAVWGPYDPAALVGRWTAGGSRGTTLVALGGDPGLLPRTVSAVLDLPAEPTEPTEPTEPGGPGRPDGSGAPREVVLDWPSAELVRRVHLLADRDGWTDGRRRRVRRALVRALAAAQDASASPGVPVPAPPRWALQQLAERSEAQVAALHAAAAEARLRVVGDLDDLRVPPPGPDAADELPPVPDLALPAAVAALESLMATGTAAEERAIRAVGAPEGPEGQDGADAR